jgi:phage gp36-like protein
MPYVTLADLSQAMPPAALTNIDPAVLQSKLDDAEATANGYLGVRYTLPLVQFGHDLRRQVLAVAVYDVMSFKGFNPESGRDMNFRDRYNDALKWFQAVSLGNVTPVGIVDSGDTPLVEEAGPIIITNPRRGF